MILQRMVYGIPDSHDSKNFFLSLPNREIRQIKNAFKAESTDRNIVCTGSSFEGNPVQNMMANAIIKF